MNVPQDDADCLRCDFDVVHLAGWRRDRQSVVSQTLDVKGDGFADFRLDLRDSGASGDVAFLNWRWLPRVATKNNPSP